MKRDDGDYIREQLTLRLEGVLDHYFSGYVISRGRAYLSAKSKRDLGSWSVHVHGPRRGQWYRFSQGVGGGVVELISYHLFGRVDAYADAFREARAFLGIAGDVDTEANQRARKAQQEARQNGEMQQQVQEQNTREAAGAIWMESGPIAGTIADAYLRSRGLALEHYPPVLRFHAALAYPNGKKYPAMVCRVDDVAGNLTAVWRIYLRSDGRKADVESAKLGLGPAGGGAVRLGGVAPKIAIGEGLESALGYWLLTGQKYPTWAGLSTAGLVGFEVPLGVDHVVVAPDGDRPIRKQGHEFVPATPAGKKAADALRARLLAEGVGVTIAAYPPIGKDFNDLWLERMREVV